MTPMTPTMRPWPSRYGATMVDEPDVGPALAATSLARLGVLVDRFLLGEAPFTARPHPLRAARGQDFDHLSRVAEWAGAEEEE